MPIFRAFPRVGIPPYYKDWDDYEERIGFMVEAGVMEDYTWLWYDVRPASRTSGRSRSARWTRRPTSSTRSRWRR